MTKPTIAEFVAELTTDPNAAGAQRSDEAVAPAASLESVDPPPGCARAGRCVSEPCRRPHHVEPRNGTAGCSAPTSW
jgi:hypothetical protein